jgi:hypothetical protein
MDNPTSVSIAQSPGYVSENTRALLGTDAAPCLNVFRDSLTLNKPEDENRIFSGFDDSQDRHNVRVR